MQRQQQTSVRLTFAVALCVMFALAVITMILPERSSTRQPSARLVEQDSPTDTPFPTPTYDPHPIANATAAISRSLELFPTGFAVTASHARLVTAATADAWRGESSLLMPDSGPVWLVGIAATGMTVGDAMPHIYGLGAATASAQGAAPGSGAALAAQTIAAVSVKPIQGMFYVWSANSGDSLGYGALASSWPQNLQSLQAISNQSLTIVAATEIVIDSPTQEPTEEHWPTP